MSQNEISSLKKMLLQLRAPYKKSEAYEVFRDKINEAKRNASVFWDTNVGYVVKYQNAELVGDDNVQGDCNKEAICSKGPELIKKKFGGKNIKRA